MSEYKGDRVRRSSPNVHEVNCNAIYFDLVVGVFIHLCFAGAPVEFIGPETNHLLKPGFLHAKAPCLIIKVFRLTRHMKPSSHILDEGFGNLDFKRRRFHDFYRFMPAQ